MGPKIRNDGNDADSSDPPAPRQDGATQSQAFDEFFNNPALGKDLRTKGVRGGTATIASQAGRFLIGTAGTAVLARILTPGDFGLLAMIAAFTRFLTLFKDLGLSTATIQRKDISHEQVNSLFWINAAIGLGIAILTVAAAPLVARFYGRSELLWITIVLAIPFVFSGLALQHTALLRRQMRFGAIAVIQVVSAAAGAVAGIIAAWMGAQYWALVVGMIVTNIVTLVVTWRLCRWRPGGPRVTSDSRELISFGGQITAAN
ncbi:MAG: oligosaccharide flippase family protein, partial [Phycisphaerales bacterium]|nr:oligosaccharide flippase family protein [Phycisphaerales bacterium]